MALTDEQIYELAQELIAGRIMLSSQVPENLLLSVFMPLALMDQKDIPKDLHTVYGHMKNTFGRAINGYPIFSSCGMLNKEETKRLIGKAKQLQSALDALKPKPKEDDKIQTKLQL